MHISECFQKIMQSAQQKIQNICQLNIKYTVYFQDTEKCGHREKHTDFINVQIVNSRFVFRKVMEEYRLHALNAEPYLKKQHKGKFNVWLCAH